MAANLKLSESLVSKYVNSKVYLFGGEAKLFVFFLVALLLVKSKIILYLLIASYAFSLYLRFSKSDLTKFLKSFRRLISGNKKKVIKKTY